MNCLPQSKNLSAARTNKEERRQELLYFSLFFPRWIALSREEERDEAQEKNQKKKDGHERFDEKEEKRRGRRLFMRIRAYMYTRVRGLCALVRMSACAPLLTYARAYAHGARLPPACVFIFIIILDIFYISYNNIYKKTRKLYVLSISLYSCLYRTRAGTHMRRWHYIVTKSILGLRW